MPKRILLIDSDESFAQGLADAAIAAGFEASMASDSEHGMALAKDENPDLIVVCVEAQPTNGYMLCTRLKKDDQLKDIPVILTSANATPDSFEKHKKLKTRAEDYLIKPFEAEAMMQMAANLLGVQVPTGAGGGGGDKSLGLGDLGEGEDESIQLGENDVAEAHGTTEGAEDVEELEELVEIEEETEPAPERSHGDEDLAMFEQAFDALKPTNGAAAKKQAPPAPAPARPAPGAWQKAQLAAPTDEEMLGGFTDEPELAIEPEPLAAKAPGTADPSRGFDSDPRIAVLEKEARQLKDEVGKRDAAAQAAQQRADTLAATAKKFERELGSAREEAKAGSKSDLARLQADADKLRQQVSALTGERDLLRDERDDLRKQLAQAQSAVKQNEERAIKAYQKLKGDEKLKEKTRKALQIALALLDDVTLGVDSESEKESA
jgi:DNA-binding response OmpR family regulator